MGVGGGGYNAGVMRKTAVIIALLTLGLLLVPSTGARQLQVQATLVTDCSPDESIVWVRWSGMVAVDQLVVLESRDRTARSSYRVRHVFDDHVLLQEPLREEYLAGSRLLQ